MRPVVVEEIPEVFVVVHLGYGLDAFPLAETGPLSLAHQDHLFEIVVPLLLGFA
jgi:hypothetical protein